MGKMRSFEGGIAAILSDLERTHVEGRAAAMNDIAERIIEDGGVTASPQSFQLAMHGRTYYDEVPDDKARKTIAQVTLQRKPLLLRDDVVAIVPIATRYPEGEFNQPLRFTVERDDNAAGRRGAYCGKIVLPVLSTAIRLQEDEPDPIVEPTFIVIERLRRNLNRDDSDTESPRRRDLCHWDIGLRAVAPEVSQRGSSYSRVTVLGEFFQNYASALMRLDSENLKTARTEEDWRYFEPKLYFS